MHGLVDPTIATATTRDVGSAMVVNNLCATAPW